MLDPSFYQAKDMISQYLEYGKKNIFKSLSTASKKHPAATILSATLTITALALVCFSRLSSFFVSKPFERKVVQLKETSRFSIQGDKKGATLIIFSDCNHTDKEQENLRFKAIVELADDEDVFMAEQVPYNGLDDAKKREIRDLLFPEGVHFSGQFEGWEDYESYLLQSQIIDCLIGHHKTYLDLLKKRAFDRLGLELNTHNMNELIAKIREKILELDEDSRNKNLVFFGNIIEKFQKEYLILQSWSDQYSQRRNQALLDNLKSTRGQLTLDKKIFIHAGKNHVDWLLEQVSKEEVLQREKILVIEDKNFIPLHEDDVIRYYTEP